MGIAIGDKHASVVWRVSVSRRVSASRRVRYGRFQYRNCDFLVVMLNVGLGLTQARPNENTTQYIFRCAYTGITDFQG